MHAYCSKCSYACLLQQVFLRMLIAASVPTHVASLASGVRCRIMHMSNCDFFEHDVSKCALEPMLASIKMPVVRMQPLGDQSVAMTS
jgi:hypothetical protein